MTAIDKEEEQRRLEQEMIKRRDRIERWRAERKRKELEIKKVTIAPTPQVKKWSLENESDDDVEEVPLKEDEPEPVLVESEPEVIEIIPDEIEGKHYKHYCTELPNKMSVIVIDNPDNNR